MYPSAGNKKRRKLLRWAQNGLCPLCSDEVRAKRRTLKRSPLLNPTTDHVIPRSLGGSDGWGNVLCTHAACNWQKKSRRPIACLQIWLDLVQAKLDQPQPREVKSYTANLYMGELVQTSVQLHLGPGVEVRAEVVPDRVLVTTDVDPLIGGAYTPRVELDRERSDQHHDDQ